MQVDCAGVQQRLTNVIYWFISVVCLWPLWEKQQLYRKHSAMEIKITLHSFSSVLRSTPGVNGTSRERSKLPVSLQRFVQSLQSPGQIRSSGRRQTHVPARPPQEIWNVNTEQQMYSISWWLQQFVDVRWLCRLVVCCPVWCWKTELSSELKLDTWEWHWCVDIRVKQLCLLPA